MGIYRNSIVKLKDDIDGSYWDLEQGKEYVVLETEWKRKENGNQEMLFLKNKQGKKRKYYEHLFDEVVVSKNDTLNEEIKGLRNIWLKDNSDESKKAYERLKEFQKEWEKNLPKKGDKIKFNNGHNSVKYKDRTFTIKRVIDSALFEKIIILKEMRGSFKLSEMDLINSCDTKIKYR